MKNKVMLGLWRYTINVPPFLWEKQILNGKKKFEREHNSIPGEHRLVHHFVVKELPYSGKPLSAKIISDNLAISLDQVNKILDDLEKRLTFLYRNKQGEVIWAYPVTVEKTPHHVTFSTGEKLYAA